MGRTKSKSKKASKANAFPAAATAPAPSTSAQPTVTISIEDLLVRAAQQIASINYEGAKKLCLEAVELAHKGVQEKQEGADPRMLRDALEILGTVELELGDIDEAREVCLVSPFEQGSGGRRYEN
jgi:3-oxoacyl-ACP reductase-like protein